MAAINCDECEKKTCPQRSPGSICSLNRKTVGIVKAFESRDPILVARKMAEVLQSEADRYEQAKKAEEIGALEEVEIFDKKGNLVKTITRKKTVDSRVSNLAFNILKGGKLINDIVNPPKLNPLFQQNNQYNISLGAVNEINSLPEDEREKALKFIDDQLDTRG